MKMIKLKYPFHQTVWYSKILDLGFSSKQTITGTLLEWLGKQLDKCEIGNRL